MFRSKKELIFQRNPEYREILHQREIESNIFIAKVLLCFGIVSLLSWTVSIADPKAHAALLPTIYHLILLLSCIPVPVFCLINGGKYKHLRQILLVASIIASVSVSLHSVHAYWIYIAVPIILSSKYANKFYSIRVTIVMLILSLLICGILTWISCTYHIYDIDMLVLPQGTTITINTSLQETLFEQGFVTTSDLIRFRLTQLYKILPALLAISYTSILIANHSWEMVQSSIQSTRREQELTTRMMLSQLQPHFLYNTLTAIMAIEGNPDETVDAIAEFGQYLRENLKTLSDVELVTFEEELEHIKRYISLEQLRFGNRLNVEYDIEVSDFPIPPLTIQMMVENAAKHGILQPKKGGKITITTRETDDLFRVIIADDGIGFNVEEVLNSNDPAHVGIQSVVSRLQILLKGTAEFVSSPGNGTVVTIEIPKLIHRSAR